MAAIYNDTQIPYGSRLVQMNATGTIYIAEDISITRPTTVIERFNELNEPSGQVIIGGFVTGNGTMQLPTSTSRIPSLGDTFTASFSGSAETFIVSNIGQAENQGTERKVTFEFRKKIN